jgi:hypothetical protein
MALIVLLLVSLCGGLAVAPPAKAADRVPAQFVAKLYSEALGRAPEPGGWSFHLSEFENAGCTLESVRHMVRVFYNSSEFLALPYDNESRLLALYRGALNREPDEGGLAHHSGTLRSGAVTWSRKVEEFANSSELAALTPRICGTNTSYYYGGAPAPTLTPSGPGFRSSDGTVLQSQLDSAPRGATVYLAQKAVVRLTTTLVVPAGKTLATTGSPPPSQYARQGRLVRSGNFAGPVVRVESGAKLRNVWVDGQRGDFRNYVLPAINVEMMGGDGTAVSDSKLSNSLGWTSLVAFGSYEGLPCPSATIRNNVVTAYSSDHFVHEGQGRFTDGLSVACEGAMVEGNDVIDATDVGVVLFRSTPAVQRSLIRNNRVLSAGNPAYAALAIESGTDTGTNPNFTGARVSDNALWTSADTHFDIGLAVGTRPWSGSRSEAGTGVAFTNNTTNGLTAVVGTGIAVSGMYRATVQGNDLRLLVRPIGACPHVGLGIDADGYAEGGDIQPGGVRVSFTSPAGAGCVGHWTSAASVDTRG